MPPAATIGDQHLCPKTTPDVHIGGKIIGPGSPTVRIGAARAARASFSNLNREQLRIQDPDAASLIEDNAAAILSAAKAFEIDPKILAGIVYVENWRNVNWTEIVEKPLGFYMETVPILNKRPSIGLAQVQTRTARFLEEQKYILPTSGNEGGWTLNLPFFDEIPIHGTEQMAREQRLEDNEFNLLYAAAYVRYFENTWREDFPQIGERADILGTLYNLGHESTSPNPTPNANDFGHAVSDSQLLMALLLGFLVGDGDRAICHGSLDQILTGSSTVFFDGLSAARLGDLCTHGGIVVSGSSTVFIGD
ncbi:PAAR domain-containing protein [Paraliomyxa miuraensis]|uniref:PAAR domain-containing protein n=1 Tax=Paraliomyxa miuraensis TaxID=376150 RepID=UPI002253CCB3|nr:PAAR domain-containing protein [Paraliomyxa miuraensis]MCX4247869.1 PAAR domain-containing protein [Paraliomyxa miuraensis]